MIRVAFIALLIGIAGCGGRGGSFEKVEFRAPSQADPALSPFLKEVDHIGVICVTNIEPFRELDIEKVMARLSNANLGKPDTMRRTPNTMVSVNFNMAVSVSATVGMFRYMNL